MLAAVFYALNAPLSKVLLQDVPPAMMAAFLYLGAGMGMGAVQLFWRQRNRESREESLTRRELPWTLAMILLDIAAPLALMLGIRRTSAATASLLNNFEIVATSLIALVFFGEKISRRLWLGIGLVTLSPFLLSMEDLQGFTLNPGALLVLAALLLGFVAYGLSILCYIYAQRELGAAKTSAYYAIAPFIGVVLRAALPLVRRRLCGNGCGLLGGDGGGKRIVMIFTALR